MHAGHITTDIIIRTGKKVSTSIFRESFDICIDCLNNTGLYKILKIMREKKERNKQRKDKVKHIVEKSQAELTHS